MNERRRKRKKHSKRSDYIASASASTFRVVQIRPSTSNGFEQRKNGEMKLTTSMSMCNNNIWKCTKRPAFFRHFRPHHVLIIQSWKTINFGYNYYRRFQFREPKRNVVLGEENSFEKYVCNLFSFPHSAFDFIFYLFVCWCNDNSTCTAFVCSHFKQKLSFKTEKFEVVLINDHIIFICIILQRISRCTGHTHSLRHDTVVYLPQIVRVFACVTSSFLFVCLFVCIHTAHNKEIFYRIEFTAPGQCPVCAVWFSPPLSLEYILIYDWKNNILVRWNDKIESKGRQKEMKK